jgi:hypothetical protein
MVVLLEGSPSNTEELWSSVSDHWVLGHLQNQDPSPPIAQNDWAASSRESLGGAGRVLVVPNFFHLRMMEATVFLGDLQCCRHFWCPSLDLCLDTILSRSSTDNSFDLIETDVCLSKSCPIN